MFGDVNESWEHQRCIIQKLTTKEVKVLAAVNVHEPSSEIFKNPRDLLSEVHQCESDQEILRRDYR